MESTAGEERWKNPLLSRFRRKKRNKFKSKNTDCEKLKLEDRKFDNHVKRVAFRGRKN